MIPIANLSRPKYGLLTVLMTAFAAYFLSQPFWVEGGLSALLRGEDDQRGWWPILAVCSAVVIALMGRAWVMLLTWKGPGLFVEDQGLRFFGWKQPIALTDIETVQASSGSLLRGTFSKVTLTLREGRPRIIPTFLLDKDATEVARAIEQELPR